MVSNREVERDTSCFQPFTDNQSPVLMVPKGGLEPPCPQGTPDFELYQQEASPFPSFAFPFYL